jgi:Flp pilus assembly protein CpaB
MKINVPTFALALSLACVLSTAKAAEKPSAPLQAGYRAVTLPVSSHQLAFVKPGDRVDVMVAFEAIVAKGEKEEVTATILQNVGVLNVSRADNLLELQLNPNEAQYAVLSLEGKKTIWIERRADGDTDMKPMEMASFRKLFR